jgi:hypothetical protein
MFISLDQVFQSKAVEFRDSISSLLGYKLHFEPKHVRLTSVYDRDIDLKFASGGGNQAVMGVRTVLSLIFLSFLTFISSLSESAVEPKTRKKSKLKY